MADFKLNVIIESDQNAGSLLYPSSILWSIKGDGQTVVLSNDEMTRLVKKVNYTRSELFKAHKLIRGFEEIKPLLEDRDTPLNQSLVTWFSTVFFSCSESLSESSMNFRYS